MIKGKRRGKKREIKKISIGNRNVKAKLVKKQVILHGLKT